MLFYPMLREALGSWPSAHRALITIGGNRRKCQIHDIEGQALRPDMAMYSLQMAADNSREISRLKRNLIRALAEDVI